MTHIDVLLAGRNGDTQPSIWKVSFTVNLFLLILRITDGRDRAARYISWRKWMIVCLLFLPLCCHYAMALHPPRLHRYLWVLTLLVVSCTMGTCCWHVAMMGGEYAKWDVWQRRGVWHGLSLPLTVSLSTLLPLSHLMYVCLLRILCAVCSFNWRIGISEVSYSTSVWRVGMRWTCSFSTSRWAWCLYYSLA